MANKDDSGDGMPKGKFVLDGGDPAVAREMTEELGLPGAPKQHTNPVNEAMKTGSSLEATSEGVIRYRDTKNPGKVEYQAIPYGGSYVLGNAPTRFDRFKRFVSKDKWSSGLYAFAAVTAIAGSIYVNGIDTSRNSTSNVANELGLNGSQSQVVQNISDSSSSSGVHSSVYFAAKSASDFVAAGNSELEKRTDDLALASASRLINEIESWNIGLTDSEDSVYSFDLNSSSVLDSLVARSLSNYDSLLASEALAKKEALLPNITTVSLDDVFPLDSFPAVSSMSLVDSGSDFIPAGAYLAAMDVGSSLDLAIGLNDSFVEQNRLDDLALASASRLRTEIDSWDFDFEDSVYSFDLNSSSVFDSLVARSLSNYDSLLASEALAKKEALLPNITTVSLDDVFPLDSFPQTKLGLFASDSLVAMDVSPYDSFPKNIGLANLETSSSVVGVSDLIANVDLPDSDSNLLVSSFPDQKISFTPAVSDGPVGADSLAARDTSAVDTAGLNTKQSYTPMILPLDASTFSDSSVNVVANSVDTTSIADSLLVANSPDSTSAIVPAVTIDDVFNSVIIRKGDIPGEVVGWDNIYKPTTWTISPTGVVKNPDQIVDDTKDYHADSRVVSSDSYSKLGRVSENNSVEDILNGLSPHSSKLVFMPSDEAHSSYTRGFTGDRYEDLEQVGSLPKQWDGFDIYVVADNSSKKSVEVDGGMGSLIKAPVSDVAVDPVGKQVYDFSIFNTSLPNEDMFKTVLIGPDLKVINDY